MAGSNSPAYLRNIATTLAEVIPHADLVTLPGLAHDAPQEVPERVAEPLRTFFSPELMF